MRQAQGRAGPRRGQLGVEELAVHGLPRYLRAVQAAAQRFGLTLDVTPIDWASCDYHAKTGQMMPDDWKAQIGGMDAIFFGAVGWPAKVPC